MDRTPIKIQPLIDYQDEEFAPINQDNWICGKIISEEKTDEKNKSFINTILGSFINFRIITFCIHRVRGS